MIVNIEETTVGKTIQLNYDSHFPAFNDLIDRAKAYYQTRVSQPDFVDVRKSYDEIIHDYYHWYNGYDDSHFIEED
jgi:hypothetical protein